MPNGANLELSVCWSKFKLASLASSALILVIKQYPVSRPGFILGRPECASEIFHLQEKLALFSASVHRVADYCTCGRIIIFST